MRLVKVAEISVGYWNIALANILLLDTKTWTEDKHCNAFPKVKRI